MPERSVVIPLDGSEFSQQILPHVENLLDPDLHELVLLRVDKPPEAGARERERPDADPDAPATEPPITPSGVERYGTEPPTEEPLPDTGFEERPVYPTQLEERRRHELEDAMDPIARHLRNIGFTVGVAIQFNEDPAQEIADFAEEEAADMIAMTTHGRSGLSRLLFGSVAEEVLRVAPMPVLLLRPSEAADEIA